MSNITRIYGYARVSANDQNEGSERLGLKRTTFYKLVKEKEKST